MSTDNINDLYMGKNTYPDDTTNSFPKFTLNKFKLLKTVYAKRKGKFDVKMLNKILALEINQHLEAYPDVEFDRVEEKPKQNSDLSVTYSILFKKKLSV